PEPSAAEVYAEVGRSFGCQLDLPTIRARFHAAFAQEDERDRAASWRTDPAREERRWRAIVAHTLPDVADPEACFRTLWDYFASPASWQIAADAAAVLAELRRRELRLGIATNFDSRLRPILAGFAELPDDLVLVISAEVGWRKPAAEFFAAVAKAIGVASSEILMIGDDPENDVRAAEIAGMRALLL